MKNMKQSKNRPPLVTLIVIINLIGWITTEGIWVYFHLTGQIPPIESAGSYWEKAYFGLVNGFTVADAVWSNLSLVFSIIGLWRMKSWGWMAAIMANTIWLYSMTFSLVRDVHIGLTPGTAFFLIFAIFAVFSTIYLWNKRALFWCDEIA
jgi:hypothetical protein